MKHNPSSTQQFNDYLAGTLSEKEKNRFEEQLQKNQELAKAFAKHQQILEGMQGARRAYFQLYRDIEGEQPFAKGQQKKAPWYLFVGVVAIIGLAFWLF